MPAYKYTVDFVSTPDESEAFFSTFAAPYQVTTLTQPVDNEAFFSTQNASDWISWLEYWENISTIWEDLR